MPSMYECPKCGEYHYHKSHSKNLYERIRKNMLNQRIYRCHRCHFRSWEKRIVISGNQLTTRKIILYLLVVIIASLIGLLFKSIII